MSLVKAMEYLKRFNLEDRIILFNDTSHTVYDASLRLNCSEGEIAKSMGFLVNNEPILVLTSGDKRIDNHKFKETFNCKCNMIKYDEVEDLIGHPPGGVCPFGINDRVKVYLDISLKQYEYVYPACGTDASAIKLSISELEKTTNYIKWVDVVKGEKNE